MLSLSDTGAPFAVGPLREPALIAAYPAARALSPRLAVRQVATFEELRCPGSHARADARKSEPVIACCPECAARRLPLPTCNAGARTVPPLLLACLAYLSVALPGSTLGLLWPSMRLSFGAPVGALGILLVPGIAASVLASALTGRLRPRTGWLVAAGTLLTALALAAETLAPWLWVMTLGPVLFRLGFGAPDAAP